MSNPTKTPWENLVVETIDQRQLELPPAWIRHCEQASEVNPRAELESGRSGATGDILRSSRDRAMASAVVSLLGRAREKAVVASFLLADRACERAIREAADRGVRVYVLLASEARLGREAGDGEFDQRVLGEHKEMLLRLAGHVLIRSAPHFHAKVVVIDPDTSPEGILLTANLTKEALERNEEMAVALSAEEVAEVTGYLKWAMWESAEHEFVDSNDRFKTTRPLNVVPHPEGATRIVATTEKSSGIREEALRLIKSAQRHLLVSSFGWDEDHEVVQRLCDRAQEGLRIEVLARVRRSSMNALLALARAGASVFGFPYLHAKAVVVDESEAVVMSANLQADGLDRGFEVGVRLSGERARLVNTLLADWRDTAPWMLALRPRIGDVRGKVSLWINDRLEVKEVAPFEELDLGEVTAESADALNPPCPTVPDAGVVPRLAAELRCRYRVVPPRLAARSKRVEGPGGDGSPPRSDAPPLFREPNGRLVVGVRTPDELERARAFKEQVGAAAIVVLDDNPS
jgi:cardiolipin synthase A/B